MVSRLIFSRKEAVLDKVHIVLAQALFQGLLSTLIRKWKREDRGNQVRSNPVYSVILATPT